MKTCIRWQSFFEVVGDDDLPARTETPRLQNTLVSTRLSSPPLFAAGVVVAEGMLSGWSMADPLTLGHQGVLGGNVPLRYGPLASGYRAPKGGWVRVARVHACWRAS